MTKVLTNDRVTRKIPSIKVRNKIVLKDEQKIEAFADTMQKPIQQQQVGKQSHRSKNPPISTKRRQTRIKKRKKKKRRSQKKVEEEEIQDIRKDSRGKYQDQTRSLTQH